MKRRITLMGGGKILLIVNEEHEAEILREKRRRERLALQNRPEMEAA